jgi:hypothetical protein
MSKVRELQIVFNIRYTKQTAQRSEGSTGGLAWPLKPRKVAGAAVVDKTAAKKTA